MSEQDTFDPETYTLIGLAKKSVTDYKHQYITPEHILLGMIAGDFAGIQKILSSSKATPDQIRALLKHHLRTGDASISENELTFSERAKRVIETGSKEAQAMGVARVRPEHLMLGLTLVTNTVCSAVLRAVGITTESVKKTL